MFKGARTILDVCVSVKRGESVCIVTDHAKEPIARVLEAAAIERGAETVVLVMEPRERAGQEPPDAIAAAMKAADIVLLPVSRSITHTYAVKEAAAAGARLLVMTDFGEETLVRGGIEADFQESRPVCKRVASILAEGRSLRITSPGGTDLSVDITGRRGNALYCIVEPGEFSTVPTIEANVSPVEGSAKGRIVADASVPYLGIGLLDEPIIADVEAGLITSIRGGRQAKVLLDDLEGHGDPASFNVAEVGVGLNPKCRMIGIMLEDEGVLGSAHIGIGTSITLGGSVKAPCHYDLLMWNPRIEVDGVLVFDRDKVVL
ncbi:MAG: leucyl aminopeptidase [Spirochaetes bacterium]|nr:leucyl aminopeptidase [Spirochaetota bacterium]MBU1082300.1 leucyl aminopeptidase [Spirochaetota bacterium]